MKKVLYSLLGVIPLAIGGYFLFQNLNGNSDAMLTYLEESDVFVADFNTLVEEEMSLVETATEEELVEYTQTTLIPALEEILEASKAYGEGIEKEELQELHNIDVESLEKYIEAQYAWLDGDYEKSDSLFVESDDLTLMYEEELDNLASKWGVEIDWEEIQQ